jgi:hypothetical protein
MGTGAIILLVVLAIAAMIRSNNRIASDDTAGAVVTCVLFVINVGILILGNPWVWAGWTGFTAAKTIFRPSEETISTRMTMPDGVFSFSLALYALVSGLVFMAFQWLR